MARTVSIGNQSFESIISNDAFYVDKTAFIADWYRSLDSITLITRPRRFGKSLTLDMLNCFFSDRYKNRSDLFNGLEISNDKEMMALQGTMPVLFLSFAGIKATTYKGFLESLSNVIKTLFSSIEKDRFLISHISEQDCQYIRDISKKSINPDGTAVVLSEGVLATVLNNISQIISSAYDKKIYIFLDEYDTPLVEAYANGYWNEASALFRILFNNTFKTNPYLDRAIMTGITRVAKESIFSDLNNLSVYTVTSDMYRNVFGFTEEEVFRSLAEFDLSSEIENLKFWYDGFIFGNQKDIYNPLSITSFLKYQKYEPYWSNSSSNTLVSSLIWDGSPNIKEQFQVLLNGDSIISDINEEMEFSALGTEKNAIWSLLVASGYLKAEEKKNGQYILSLTNYEVQTTFEKMVNNWFQKKNTRYDEFITALLNHDIAGMEDELRATMIAVTSVMDTGDKESSRMPENFYHGLVLGMTLTLKDRYVITSNRESGYGRYDVMLKPRNTADPAYIIEFKVQGRRETSLEETIERALNQLQEKCYIQVLLEEGFLKEQIHLLGMAFSGKEVLIREG